MASKRALWLLLPLLVGMLCQACGASARKGAMRRLLEVTARVEPAASAHSLLRKQPSPPAPGLPRECLTYQERYGVHQYHSGLTHSVTANAQHPHSRFVVLLKLHRVYEDRWPLDLILNIRAVASEVTASGYHFFILFQPPTDAQFTREEVLEFLPADLRPFVLVHDYADDYDYYHALSAHDNEGKDTYDTWGPGPKAPYVAIARFFRRYKAYEYAWILEYDVRWMGGSWGELLNAALDLGRQATQQELDAHPKRLVDVSRVASRALPTSTDGLPDLLNFDGMGVDSNWRILPNNMANSSQLYSMGAQVYLGSRRLWEAAHEYSLKGVGTHIEAALATMAMQRKLKTASIAIPDNDNFPDYYSCCAKDALKIYGAWFNVTATCTPSLLIHPIKISQAYWPSMEIAH